MHAYTATDLKRLFNLSATFVRSLARAGYISSTASQGKTEFTFQDLLILRTASALKAARIPAAKIIEALGKIRASLPPGSVLTTLALAASGKDLVLRDGSQEWEANSGQYPLPLAPHAKKSRVTVLAAPAKRPEAIVEADQHYSRGHALEETDLAGARAAYLAALNASSDHLEARINLGRLLHLAGELKEAEKIYRQARRSSALLSFNLAILLEDLQREDEAVVAYREALAQDPSMQDAHFNLSRLHERANNPQDALRHMLAYRRYIALHGE